MGKIFISGGGDYQKSYEFDQLFINDLDIGKRILYIPWAFYPQRYDSGLTWIENVFPKEKGYSIKILSETSIFDLNEIIDSYDGIYIGGGNTFRLLKLIKQTGFIEVIKKFFEIGKPIYGGSAGAIIMGKEIHTSPDLNIVKLNFEDSTGMDYFEGYSIFCHYKEKYDPEIYDYIKNYDIPVICLPEGVGLVRDKDKFSVGGIENAYILSKDSRKKICIGEYTTL